MSVKTEPKVFMQNKLARSQAKLEETQSLVKTKGERALSAFSANDALRE